MLSVFGRPTGVHNLKKGGIAISKREKKRKKPPDSAPGAFWDLRCRGSLNHEMLFTR
jgi:hypothetical protein